MKTEIGNQEELLKCPICQVYFRENEGFICLKCRGVPLCKKHRVSGKRECAGCIVEMLTNELNALKKQEKSIKYFLRLLQFIFLVFSIFFIALKMGLADVVDLLQNNIIVDNLLFFGGMAVLGYLIFYIILYTQRNTINGLESQVKKIEIRR